VLALHVHRHLRGPKGDYLGLFAGAVASWAGVPGPGEAALVTAGILAAHHHLDIGSAVVVAWIGATTGGMVGWLIGLKAGRAVIGAAGPLRRLRLAALARGEVFYERYGILAVFFTPSWVAGVHRMRASRYVPANAASALLWALIVGLGAYLLGPSISDILSDIGLAGSLALGAVLVTAAVVAWRRRRSRPHGDG
jgi:membrane protein DedA with SNARE-associated domain